MQRHHEYSASETVAEYALVSLQIQNDRRTTHHDILLMANDMPLFLLGNPIFPLPLPVLLLLLPPLLLLVILVLPRATYYYYY